MADKKRGAVKQVFDKFLTFFRPEQITDANKNFEDFVDVPDNDPYIETYSVVDDAVDKLASSPNVMGYDSTSSYKNLVYGRIPNDKPKRLKFYRNMAFFPEVNDAIDEICDSCLNYDENDKFIELITTDDNLTEDQKLTLKEEFEKFIALFDIENEGWTYFYDLVVDGELCFENLMDENKKDLGIVGVKRIPTDSYEYLIDINSNIVGLLVNAKIIFDKTGDGDKVDLKRTLNDVNDLRDTSVKHLYGKRGKHAIIPFHINQVTLVNTGKFNLDKTIAYPYLESARRAYRQLSLIEDAIIIYRLVRAPERLVFNVDTGSLPPAKAEEMVFKMMKRYQNKKVYDPVNGTVVNDYDPHQMIENYFFPKMEGSSGTTVNTLQTGCFDLSTKIPLLNGKTLKLEDIIEEYNNGKELWAYSCNPETGSFAPGRITWAGVTRRNEQVLRLTLDNGKTITCTLDHKFPVWGKGKTEAKDLCLNDSLISFNLKKSEGSGKKKKMKDYTMIYNHETNAYEFVHQTVSDYFKNNTYIYDENIIKEDNKFSVRHHKDMDKNINSPENLVWMSWKDHIKYHGDNNEYAIKCFMDKYNNDPVFKKKILDGSLKGSKAFTDRLKSDKEFKEYISFVHRQMWLDFSEERYNDICGKLSKSLIEYCSSLTDKERDIRGNNSRKAFKQATENRLEKYLNDEDYKNDVYKKVSSSLKNTLKDPKQRERIIKNNKLMWTDKSYRQKMLDATVERWEDDNRRQKCIENMSIQYNHKLLKHLIDIIEETGITNQKQLIKYINENTCEFKKEFEEINNLNVYNGFIKIPHIQNLIKKFGYENYKHFIKTYELHNHRIIKIEYLEERMDVGTVTIDGNHELHDYHTFAIDSGVYTFNSSLGNLEDLQYFLRKLYLSLKVPFDRFSDQPIPVEKSETISYEEYRFGKFIMRIQQQFAKGLFHGFITHLKLIGLWEKFKMNKRSIKVMFTKPTNFDLYEQQKLINLRMDNFNRATEHEMFSKDLAAKKYLKMSDSDLEENFKYVESEMLRAAYLNRKVDSIGEYGTPYGADVAATAGEGEEDLGMGGEDLGGLGGGDVNATPEGGAEGDVNATPEGGAEGGESEGEF